MEAYSRTRPGKGKDDSIDDRTRFATLISGEKTKCRNPKGREAHLMRSKMEWQ
jgi:hypothetical protein